METNASRPGEPVIPARLGPYEIRGVLGQGGMGIVYSGYDSSLDRRVAVKVLAPVLANNPEYRERFLREARAMAAVMHRNVAQVHFAGEDGGVPFFAMELIEGESALDRLQRGSLPVDDALDIVLQAATGLAEANQRGIIHRDVKPSNLMCATDGTVKVLDFGLARAASQSHLTAADMIMGSPDYMSPEVGRGKEPDHRSDIYGLGATLYHLLTGAPPFPGTTPLAIIQSHVNDPCRPLDQVRADVPESVCRVVERMMDKNPDRRQQGYGQLMRDVASLRQSPEAQAIRSWNESSPHNHYWSFVWRMMSRPSEAFTREVLERDTAEIEGFLMRTTAFATIMHALCVPMDRWGPHQIVLYAMFAFCLPGVLRGLDRLACKLFALRATRMDLMAVEHYASACLIPLFLMPRRTPVVMLIALVSFLLYLRTRAAGLSFVTGLARGRAVALSIATGVLALLLTLFALRFVAAGFVHLGYVLKMPHAGVPQLVPGTSSEPQPSPSSSVRLPSLR